MSNKENFFRKQFFIRVAVIRPILAAVPAGIGVYVVHLCLFSKIHVERESWYWPTLITCVFLQFIIMAPMLWSDRNMISNHIEKYETMRSKRSFLSRLFLMV